MDPKNNNRLLTARIFKYMRRGVKYGERIQAHPFKWNDKKGKPELLTSRRLKILYCGNIAAVVSYCIFVMIRVIQVCFLWENTTDFIKIYMTFNFFVYFFALVTYLNISADKKELLAFVRGTLGFLMEYERRCSARTKGNTEVKSTGIQSIKICEIFMRATFICFNCNAFLLALLSIIRPKSPEFLSSVVLTLIEGLEPRQESASFILPGYTTIWFYLLKIAVVAISFIFQAWILYNAYSLVFLHALLILGLVFPMLVVVDELKSGYIQFGEQTDSPNETSPSCDQILTWKAVHIIVRGLNQVFRIFIVGAKADGIAVAVFCFYSAIKFSGVIGAGLGFVGTAVTAFIVGFFTVLYGFNEKSTQVLTNWKHSSSMLSKHTLLRKKYVQSLNPMSLAIGGMYLIDKLMLMSMFRFILESTASMIITYR